MFYVLAIERHSHLYYIKNYTFSCHIHPVVLYHISQILQYIYIYIYISILFCALNVMYLTPENCQYDRNT